MRFSFFYFVFLSFYFFPIHLMAQSTWQGGNNNNNWSDGTNWNNGVPTNDSAFFPVAAVTNSPILDSTQAVTDLNFEGDGDVFITGNVGANLNAGGGIILQPPLTNEKVIELDLNGQLSFDNNAVIDMSAVNEDIVLDIITNNNPIIINGTLDIVGDPGSTQELVLNCGTSTITAPLIRSQGAGLGLITTASQPNLTSIQSDNNVQIDVQDGFSSTLSGAITCNNLTKAENGTLILSGNVQVTNSINVARGTLQVNDGSNTSNAEVITLDGATFRLNVTQPTLTYSGDFDAQPEGGTILEKTGVGRLDFTNNLVSTPTVLITAGDIRITQTSPFADTVSIVNNSASATGGFEFVVNDGQPSLTNNISGTGGFRKSGNGTLILEGTNTFQGVIQLTGGGLVGNTAAINTNADLSDAAVLAFAINEGEDETYSAAITGPVTSSVLKSDLGTLTFDQAHVFAGNYQVTQGTLAVSGAGDIGAGNQIAVSNGARLQGNGTVCEVDNSGTVAPGNSIGTLTIAGNYTQNADGNLEVEISPTQSDILIVQGNAIINGGTLTVLPEAGVYLEGMTYDFIQATGETTGDFDQLVEDHAADFSASIVGNNFRLFVVSSIAVLPVSAQELQGNPRAVEDYLYANGFIANTSGALFQDIQTLTQSSARLFSTNLIKISPLIYSALPRVNLQNDTRIAQAMTKRLKDCCKPYQTRKERRQKRRLFRKKERLKEKRRQYTSCTGLLKSRSEGYLEPIYFFYHQKASQGPFDIIGQPAFDANTYGFAAGWNYSISKHFLLQVGSGYTHSSIFWEQSLGHGKWDTFYFGPLFGWSNRKCFANVLLLSSYNFYDVKRRIQFSSVNYQAKYKNPSFDFLLRFAGGAIFKLRPKLYLEPEGQFNFLTVLSPKVDEQNAGPLNLHINKTNTFYLQPNVRVRLIRDFYSAYYCFSPSLYVGWLANIPLSNGKITARFEGEQTLRYGFQTQGYRDTTNQLIVGLECVIRRYDSFRLSTGFEWNTLGRYQIYQTNLKLEWSF